MHATSSQRTPLLLAIFVPVFLFSITSGVLQPLMPLYVADFDISYTAIGLVLAASGIGTMIGDVPAGVLLRRFSIKTGMIAGLLLWGGAMTTLFWAGTIWWVVIAQGVGGIGRALFIVSWHAYIVDAVELARRGRINSRMGGIFRTSSFVAPALGGAVAEYAGRESAFLLVGAICVVSLAFVIRFTRPERSSVPHGSAGLGHMGSSLVSTFRANARILAVAGVGQMLTSIVRVGRGTILPLYGADVLGLSDGRIGLILSLAAGMDLLVFPSAGFLMDRYGRKYAIVPSFIIQAIGMALIPLTGSFAGLVGVGMVIGMGNGISAGTMLTLGADLAPDDARGEFIGLWHLLGDLGFAGGPLVVGTVADIVTLPTAAFALMLSGFAAAYVFGRFVPETLERPDRAPILSPGK